MNVSEIIKRLEPHKYKNIYFEEDVPFQNDSSRIITKMFYFGIVLIFLSVILSFIIRVPREIHLKFELTGGLNEKVYQYPDKMYITKKYVSSGEKVSKHQILVSITSPRIAEQIEDLKLAERKIKDFKTVRQDFYNAEKELINAEILGLSKEINKILVEMDVNRNAKLEVIEQMAELEKIEQKQFERNKQLYDSQFISDSELEKSYESVQKIKVELNTKEREYDIEYVQLESKLAVKQSQKEIMSKKLSKLYADFHSEENELQRNYDNAKNRIRLNFGEAEIDDECLNICSPQNGIISFITEKERLLDANQILLKIQTDSTGFSVHAFAESKHIGQLHLEDKVVLKYSSFPHYYYGTMRAKVVSLSPSPNENGLFPITMEIIDSGRLKDAIKKGMTGTATIILENKPIADFIFRKFLKEVTIKEHDL